MTNTALQHEIALIGGGKMGEAMASGWISSGVVGASRLVIVEPSEARRAELAALNVRVLGSVADALPADIIVLAVKPQVLAEVVAGIAPSAGRAVVISVAAGISCARLESLLPAGTPVVRVMPNTPALVGEGMAVISAGTHATDAQVSVATRLFDALGISAVVDEQYQNACTALSGSGPAYFALVVDALAEAGTAAGLTPDLAHLLALQTMRGTGALLAETGMTPQELIQAVSSPGGTTVAALAELDRAGLRNAFDEAVRAAVSRAEELGA